MKRIGKLNGKTIFIGRDKELKVGYLASTENGVTTLKERKIAHLPLVGAELGTLNRGPKKVIGKLNGKPIFKGEENRMKDSDVIVSEGVIRKKGTYVGLPNNEIWYTSTDGNIITPTTPANITGSVINIVSNTYENGKGIIVFDGDIHCIGNNAFAYCSRLTSIIIPSSVTEIGHYAFNNCGKLTSLTIPSSVTSLGNNVFRSCKSLTSVTIPNGVTRIDGSLFYECTSLMSLTIPESVTSIGYNAFLGCKNLTSIIISSNVTSIGNCAFASCSGLTSVTIPMGVKEIGDVAFQNCTRLTSITYTGTTSQWNSITLETDWKLNVPATVVHCSDGDVTLS